MLALTCKLVLLPICIVSLSLESDAQEMPQSVDQTHFEALKTHSPFVRVLDLSETYALRGVAVIGNQAVARLYDRSTKKTVTVTETEANRLGMTLVGVTNDPNNLEGVSVRISVGNEEVDLHYDSAQLIQEPKKKVVYKVDSRGRAIPPQKLMENYRSMTREQHIQYGRWRSEYYKKNPKLENSAKRFPAVEKAINAIKAGKKPPKG